MALSPNYAFWRYQGHSTSLLPRTTVRSIWALTRADDGPADITMEHHEIFVRDHFRGPARIWSGLFIIPKQKNISLPIKWDDDFSLRSTAFFLRITSSWKPSRASYLFPTWTKWITIEKRSSICSIRIWHSSVNASYLSKICCAILGRLRNDGTTPWPSFLSLQFK